MAGPQQLTTLKKLEDLRQRDVDSKATEVGRLEQERQRYLRNLSRLSDLAAHAGPSGGLPARLMGAGAAYKLSLLRLADEHAQDLALHDDRLAHARLALQHAARKKEVISTVCARAQAAATTAAAKAAQKAQDEISAQLWLRRAGA
jgi:flagellar export protein FliJ